MELLATIAIIAVLTITAGFFTVSYINWSQQNSNNRTLMTLNTALQTYKTLGGMAASHSLQGLNSHAEIVSIYNALQNGFTVGGEKRVFMNKGTTLSMTQLYAAGSGASFNFCGFGDNTNPSTLAGTYVAQYVPPPALVGTPAYAGGVNAGGGGSVILTLNQTPTAGNTLIVCTSSISGTATISSVQHGADTFSLLKTAHQSGCGITKIWACANVTGSGNTITLTTSAWDLFDVVGLEISAMPSALTTDGGSVNNAGSGSTVTTPSVTPTAGKNVLVIGIANTYPYSGMSLSPTNGFIDMTGGAGSGYMGAAYKIISSASGSYQTGWGGTMVGYAIWGSGIQVLDGN